MLSLEISITAGSFQIRLYIIREFESIQSGSVCCGLHPFAIFQDLSNYGREVQGVKMEITNLLSLPI